MQQNGPDKKEEPGVSDSSTDHKLATNPNPRANENLEGTQFDQNTPNDDTPDVGSEITDGEAS